MRIQEMRSGLSHLKRKSENAPGDRLHAAAGLGADQKSNAVLEVAEPEISELDKHQWSVISFDKTEAGGLTYAQAEALMAELDSCGITGLCVVTGAAAARLG